MKNTLTWRQKITEPTNPSGLEESVEYFGYNNGVCVAEIRWSKLLGWAVYLGVGAANDFFGQHLTVRGAKQIAEAFSRAGMIKGALIKRQPV